MTTISVLLIRLREVRQRNCRGLHLGHNIMETSVNICKTRRRNDSEGSNVHNDYLEKNQISHLYMYVAI